MVRPTDLAHFTVGLLASLLGLETPLTVLFVVYQLVEKEPSEEKLRDLLEYAAGLIVGRLVALFVFG